MNQLIKNKIEKQLLNFDQEIEFNKSNSVQKSIDKSIEREKWILENTVDLELPSGTIWMKNNLGATCMDTVESWAGNYYAWGELTPKKEYTRNSYTYKEFPNILPLDHDVVYQKTNGICHMPTKEQIEELVNETSNQWIENYNKVKGLNGKVFTGSNGNILFFPAVGFYHGSIIYSQGTYCDLWSKSVYQFDPGSVYQFDTDFAYKLDFDSNNIQICNNFRFLGLSVRGIL